MAYHIFVLINILKLQNHCNKRVLIGKKSMCLAAKGRLQGRADKLMLCARAIIQYFKERRKNKNFKLSISFQVVIALHITAVCAKINFTHFCTTIKLIHFYMYCQFQTEKEYINHDKIS